MRDQNYIRLINCQRWWTLRKRVLSLHPLCEECYSRGEVKAATEVHHIRPIQSIPNPCEQERLAYDESNLQALCHDCHAAIHKGMGQHSKKMNKERQDALLAFALEKF